MTDQERSIVEAEFRALFSAIPLEEVDAPDPELDSLSGIITGEWPVDYRELLLEKYFGPDWKQQVSSKADQQ